MNSAIDILMDEHQVILRVLASLEVLARDLQVGKPVPRNDIADFARFFRDFADKCHHCKEENRLFVTMNRFGFPAEYGPVAVMLSEHTEGRGHVRVLVEIGSKSGDLTSGEIQEIIHHIAEFVPLLSSHIGKEDNILYPMARNAIPASEVKKLDGECAEFEHQVIGVGEVEELRLLAARLAEAYPAEFQRMATRSACFSCH